MNGNGNGSASELAEAIRDAGKYAGRDCSMWTADMVHIAEAIREAGSNIGYGGDAVAESLRDSVAAALRDGLTSADVRSKSGDAANVVDALDRVADGLFAIAMAIGGARNDPSQHWGGHGLNRGQP